MRRITSQLVFMQSGGSRNLNWGGALNWQVVCLALNWPSLVPWFPNEIHCKNRLFHASKFHLLLYKIIKLRSHISANIVGCEKISRSCICFTIVIVLLLVDCFSLTVDVDIWAESRKILCFLFFLWPFYFYFICFHSLGEIYSKQYLNKYNLYI